MKELSKGIISVNTEHFDMPLLCIPASYNTLENGYTLAGKFNGATHYCMVNLSENTYDFVKSNTIYTLFNRDLALASSGIRSVICGHVAPMALKVLYDNDIEVYEPIGDDILKNIALYRTGELNYYNLSNVPQPSCSSDCTSCGTTCNQ